jgi:ADP-heptose:LPS heptosyltransferase
VRDKRSDPANFYEATRNARRLMLLDLGFLGDSIHLFPSLWTLRQAYPNAELHVMVSEHVAEIMKLAPWIDQIWGYPRFPRRPKWYQDLARILKLRKTGFDAIVNLNGSDRSSLLTRLSGAPHRLGRVPEDGGPPLWRAMFNHIIDHPYKKELISIQRWRCLVESGIPGSSPGIHIEVPEAAKAGIAAKAGPDGGWIHISPFATLDYKELPANQLSELLRGLNRQHPEKKIILTCAPNERERSKMNTLLASLDFTPWRVFAGDLGLLELAALVQSSCLHIGGDSGGLHIAWVTGVPTVTWFREYDGLPEWRPLGPKHLDVVGKRTPSGVVGIETWELHQKISAILKSL